MAEGGNGNINLSLSLNTSPATQELKKYYTTLQKGAQDSSKAQKLVGTELARLAKAAKQVGVSYNKATKSFKDSKGVALSVQEVQKRVKKLNEELGRTEGTAKNALGGIGQGFKQVLQGIPQGIGLAIGQQLLAPINNLGAALKGAANEAVSAFVTLDQAVRQTASISGEGDAAYSKLTKAVTDLAAASKFTTGELGAATTGLARAGFSANEIAEALPGVSQGAAAAGASMEEMSDVVIAALGGFQISTSETGDVVDILTAAANNANTDVRELGEGLKYVGPIAKNLGLSLADTAAVAGVLANNGIKASQMGTALRMGLSRLGAAAGGTETAMGDLGRGTANQAEVLKRLGVELATANGELVPFPELLSRLREGFSKLTSIEGQQASRILFGSESATAFMSLLNTSASEVEGFFEVTNNASGTAAETARNNLKGLAGSLDLLASAQNAMFTDLGEALGTFIKPLVDGLTNVINAFNGLPEPVKDAVFAVTALAGAVGLVTAAYIALKAVAATKIFTDMIGGAASAVAQLLVLKGSLAASLPGAIAKATKALKGLNAAAFKPISIGAKQAASSTASYATAQKTVAAATAKSATAAGANAVATKGAGAAAAASTGGFKALAGSLATTAGVMGVFVGAAAAVFAVFDTWNQISGGTNALVADLDEKTAEFTKSMKELGTEIDANNEKLQDMKWEQSVQRVGALQAGLDKLRGAVGLQTAEDAQLNEATIKLGDAIGRRTDAQLAAITALEEEKKALQGLNPASEEYKEKVESLAAKEALLKENIADTEKMIKNAKKQYVLTGKAVEDMTEQEKMLNQQLEGGENLLEAYSGALNDTKVNVTKLKTELDKLNEADEKMIEVNAKQIKTAERLNNKFTEMAQGIQAQRAALSGLAVGSDEYKAAVDELAKSEQKFQSELDRQKSKLEGLLETHELAGKSVLDMTDAERELFDTLNEGIEEIDAFSDALQNNAVTSDKAKDAMKEYKQGAKDALKTLEDEVNVTKEAFESQMDAMEQAFENAIAKMEEDVEIKIGIKEGEIERVGQLGDATVAMHQKKIDAIQAADAENQRAAEAEIAAINRAQAAFEQAERAKISAAQQKASAAIAAAESVANAELSAARTASQGRQSQIQGQIAAAGEAAKQAQQQSQQKLKAELDSIARQEQEARDAADAELRQIKELEVAEKARFEAMKDSAQDAHDAVMADFDQQSMKLSDLRDQASGVFDGQIAKLQEMSPAEKKLHELRIAQLKKEAQAGGEDGLRAQAQLDRMKREEDIAKLQEQKAAAIAALKEREDAIEVQRQQQKINFEGTMLGITELQSQRAEELGNKRAAIENALDVQLQAFEARRKAAQEAAAKREAAAAQAAAELQKSLNAELKAEQERLAEEEKGIREGLAKEKLAIETQLSKDVAGLEEGILEAKEETKEDIDKILEARFKAEQKLIKETAKLEAEIVGAKEETKREIDRINGEILGLEQGLIADKAQLEGEFQKYKYELLTAYNKAVGESHKAILRDGDTTWRNYANNALQNLKAVERKIASLSRKKKQVEGGSSSTETGGGGPVTTTSNADGSATISNLFTGGPVSGGKNYTVNEFGQEAFLTRAGELSMINAPAWGKWRPKTAGTVLNAEITKRLGLPSRGKVDISGAPVVSGNAAGISARQQSNNMAQIIQGLNSAISGDAITNNVTIQAQNTTKAASDMLVELTRVRNRRLR